MLDISFVFCFPFLAYFAGSGVSVYIMYM
jgi:hypothetical protein